MKIDTSERVVYKHNPLAEVICQVQFQQLPDFEEREVEELKSELAVAGYPGYGEEVSFGFAQQVDPSGSVQAPVLIPQTRIRHFSTADGAWKISICPTFVALSCLKYTSWTDFLPRLVDTSKTFHSRRPSAAPSRLGLRYKDVVEREPLGLAGVPWHELISPFLLGALAPYALADGQTAEEGDVQSFLSQTLLRLDDSMVLLQSSLLTSIEQGRRAFLIDADFYNEGNLEADLLANPGVLKGRLETLHASAGHLFRRGITERLHHALL